MAKKIKDLIEVLRSPKSTSAHLAKALEVAREMSVGIASEMTAASEAYSTGLLDLDAEQLNELTARRQAASVELDRVEHLIHSLITRHDGVRASEEASAFEAERSAVDAEAERVSRLIQQRYPKLAAELVDLLKQLDAADRQVGDMNKRLYARREAPLLDVQKRVLPQPTDHHGTEPSIWSGTVLQEIKGFAPGWEITPFNQWVGLP